MRMPRHLRRSVLLAVLAVSTLSTIAAPTVAAASVSVSGSAVAGGYYKLSGSGFVRNGAYLVRLDSNSRATKIVLTSASGTFLTRVPIPSATSLGTHRISLYRVSRSSAEYWIRKGSKPAIPKIGAAYSRSISVGRCPTAPSPTGSDQTSALQRFIDSRPNDSTLCFSGAYRVDGTLKISHRSWLTLRGGTFQRVAGTSPRSMWQVIHHSSYIFLRGMTLSGAARAGDWSDSTQYEMGFDIKGSYAITVDGSVVRNLRGDGVHVAYDNSAGGDNSWADRVTIVRSTFTGLGRHGVSVTGGKRVTATHNTIDKVGMYSFDVEPDGLSYGKQTGAASLNFSYNTVGSNGIDGTYSGYVLGVGGHGPISDLRFAGNRMTGGLTVTVSNKTHRPKRITVINNVSNGGGMSFTNVDGVSVHNNDAGARFSGCTGVSYS